MTTTTATVPGFFLRRYGGLCKMNKHFLSMCAGPLLLALAANVQAASCTTYDEDVEVANTLPEMCDWNTYMCCWTGHVEFEEIDNTDVCRVLDYPGEGGTLELPGDIEGPVYCHGFAWAHDDELEAIYEMYHYLNNLDCTDDGGYYGHVEGAPDCGCIEDMPIVSTAACSTYVNGEIHACEGDSLLTHYNTIIAEPMEFNLVDICNNAEVAAKASLPDDVAIADLYVSHDDTVVVEDDDIVVLPPYDFSTCNQNTYMCCWTKNDKGVQDNTDVCRVGGHQLVEYAPDNGGGHDLHQFIIDYPQDSEGRVHCHGWVWPEDATDVYNQLLAQYVITFDHDEQRGYYGNIEGAPMCGCLEDMPQVSRADCTTYGDPSALTFTGSASAFLGCIDCPPTFTACTNNDLRTRYLEEYPNGVLTNLVVECDNA